ncbi:MAG: Cell division transporter, ATP-binding protein FtsE (TC 3.A.5.1.1) [uncultured Thiotrichaceae bacterium]|uniref:Cell division ATP-binding protein FtsE n=1 Tax=uncultured Thiotrichaceae bacterium TaxID=298394 RepID=A0A6S6T5W4_9GAMM|nr:MAG: Cell division transporter, ATP-binding protein FtsE (TC 3.A.5.1.1) [uncultured Thiotrichaceae bacterium]
MIEFHKVSKRYPTGQLALYNVNLTLQRGEMAFLAGHSGAGKSTLLKLIAILEHPTQGDIIINGKAVSTLNPRRIPAYRRKIGMIFQNPHLLPDRSIFDNVALPLRIVGMAKHDIRRRVQAALDKVSLLHKQKQYPMMLSAGEQQRVGIARAVINKPSIILADEPTGNLDPELAQDIMYTFQQFNELGATVLIASHDHHLIEQMQKRIIVLQKTEI